MIEECQRLQIAHNLFAARNSSGYLRVVLWPRRSVLGEKACLKHLLEDHDVNDSAEAKFDVAVAELAGMLVVPDDSTAQELTSSPERLLDVLRNERAEESQMSKLKKALEK